MKKTRTMMLPLAGLLVCCAVGESMSGRARATDPVGLTKTVLAGPIAFGDIDIHSLTPTHFAQIETFGSSDVYIMDITIAPGGHTGWHSHPGVALLTVKSGEGTEYHGDNPHCTPI